MAVNARGALTVFDEADDITVSASAPSAKITGTVWFDTTNNLLKRWNGSAWVEAVDSRVAGIASRVTSAETSITQNSTAIALKASQTDLTALETRVGTAELAITPTAIVSTVRSSTGYVNDLAGKAAVSDLTSLSSTVSQQANEIAARVTQSAYDAEKTYRGTSAPGSPAEGMLWLDTGNNLLKRYASGAWVAAGTDSVASAGVTISAGKLSVASTGEVEIATNVFDVQNTSGDSLMRVSASGENEGNLVLGAGGGNIVFGGNFSIPPENGGSGYARQVILMGNSVPAASLGQNGDLYILHSGVATGYADVAATLAATTHNDTSTVFGLTRRWNSNRKPGGGALTGYSFAGNYLDASGSADRRTGSYASFVAPATLSSATYRFAATKQLAGEPYGNNTTNPLVAAIFASTAAASPLGSAAFKFSGMAAQTVRVTITASLTAGQTYCLAVYDAGTGGTKNQLLIDVSSVVLEGSGAGDTPTHGLYIKSSGAWCAV